MAHRPAHAARVFGLALLAWQVTQASPVLAADARVRLRADRVENDRATSMARAIGNVRMEVEGSILTTDHLDYDQAHKVVMTDAEFTLQQTTPGNPTQTISGTGLRYELDTERAVIRGARLDAPAQAGGQRVYLTGEELTAIGRQEFEFKEGTFTTCDLVSHQETPHTHIQAGWLKYVPDSYVMGSNVLVYVNNQPVAWLPFFWVPLQKRDSLAQFGRNSVEGLFAKTALPYRLSSGHSGTVFLHALEFFKPGAVGLDHVWERPGQSITALTLYGLPLPDLTDYVPGAATAEFPDGNPYSTDNPWIAHRLDPASPWSFQDHWFRFRHQQRVLGSMTLDGWYEDRNLYDLSRIAPTFDREKFKANPRQSYRDDHTAWYLGMTDNRGGISTSANRNFRQDHGFDFQRTRTVSDNAQINGTVGPLSFSGRTSNQESTRNLPLQMPKGTPEALVPTRIASPTVDVTWSNNLSLNQSFGTETRANLTLDHTRNTPAQSARQERLTASFDLSRSLGWGNLKLQATRLFNLAIAENATDAQRKQAIASLGYVDKVPELTLSSNPLLETWQPVTLSGQLGRYVEDGAYDPAAGASDLNPAKRLEPVTRAKFQGELSGKPLDLGLLGAKLNFGSTGYEQRFYSTGDSEYRVTGQVALTTDWERYLNTSLTYRRDYTPPLAGQETPPGKSPQEPFALFGSGTNASPFKQFESLSLSRQHLANGSVNLGWNEAFTWNNSLGYNFEIERFLPYSTGLTFRPSRQVNLTINSGYVFKDQPRLEFGTGKWQDLNATLHVQSNEGGFGGTFGQDVIVPGWSLDTTAVYSIDGSEWRGFSNRIMGETGTSWQDHWALSTEGAYNVTNKRYEVLTVGLHKDLHDFILSFQYNLRLESYTVNLAMIAFPTNLFNLSNKSFGGVGDPAQGLGSLGMNPLSSGMGGFGGFQ